MTSEERMIITFDDTTLENTFGVVGQDGELNYFIEGFYKLEPAPPKDFKPKCYHEKIATLQPNEQWAYDTYKCVSCDIRESCIYKRE